MPRKVVFVVYPGFQLLGLAGPICAFQIAKEDGLSRAYEVAVVSSDGGPVTCSAGVTIQTTSFVEEAIDTLIIVGGRSVMRDSALREVSLFVDGLVGCAQRIASICTGSFVLAELGLLKGRLATTHWRHISKLQADFTDVHVQSERIYTRDANFWTSGGISAGIDLALALIEEDLGEGEARRVAQDLAVPHRSGDGELHYATILQIDGASDRVHRVLVYAQDNLRQELSTSALAKVACVSERQLERLFRQEIGLSIAKVIERLRANSARSRVEGTVEPIEHIAEHCGFGDPERMRRAFVRLFGNSPRAIRSGLTVDNREPH